MYRCICCGHMTEGDGYIGDICSHCSWEMGVDENLNLAQANYAKHGSMHSMCTSCGMLENTCICGWCQDCNSNGPHLCTEVYPNFHCTACKEGMGDSKWWNCKCYTPKWSQGPIPADKKKPKRDTRLKCPPSLQIVGP